MANLFRRQPPRELEATATKTNTLFDDRVRRSIVYRLENDNMEIGWCLIASKTVQAK